MNLTNFYAVIINPHDDMRATLPHMLNILGCGHFGFYHDVPSAFMDLKKDKNILFFLDVPLSFDFMKQYASKSQNFSVVMMNNTNNIIKKPITMESLLKTLEKQGISCSR